MLKAALVVMMACVGILWIDNTNVYAQETKGSQPAILAKPRVDLAPLTLWPVKDGRSAIERPIRAVRLRQVPRTNPPRSRARSRTRIVAGAIAGSIGGFFAGGFLGAHIEGDRCNCDDPGVQGFLIGAPIGALAGGILGGKFLF
jgi:hypothetical protein